MFIINIKNNLYIKKYFITNFNCYNLYIRIFIYNKFIYINIYLIHYTD